MIYVSNPQRGCGRLKKGGCYGGADMVPGGQLASWTWLLGNMWEDASECMIPGDSIPARAQIAIAPLETLEKGELWLYEWKHMAGDFGIADHIGSEYYTPVSFYEEVVQLGPNRRIAKPLATQWAKKVPFPIFFSHSEIPLFSDVFHAESFLDWAMEERLITGFDIDPEKKLRRAWGRTWEGDLDFGFASGDYHGQNHNGVLILKALERARAGETEIPEELQPAEYEEYVYGASWITRVYVVMDEEEELDEKLADSGVIKAVIQEEHDSHEDSRDS